jgi:hypothetical protein
MEKEKKKMDDLTKAKLVYCGELFLFAIVFIVLGILNILKVILIKDWKETVFNWLTLVGGFVTIGDFIWLCCSKKRQKKNSLIDKILPLPLSVTLIILDLFTLIQGGRSQDYYQYTIGGAFCYLAAVYLFESIFHYFHSSPALLNALQEDNAKKEEPAKEEPLRA